MNQAIKLSIIIPVYNRQKSLEQLLTKLTASITISHLTDVVELVVIDDHSLIATTVNQISFPILLKRNKENSGAPFSRAKGFQLSQGQFIHFHDSDDSISDSWLLDVIEELKNKSNLDILMTGRIDIYKEVETANCQKYFHKYTSYPEKINLRLVYRNCMGPLGGVTFSRRVLEKIEFKRFASCQDWQMYIDAIKHSQTLISRPDIKFIFNKTGDDRISHNPRKKILGHLQLAKITSKQSVFDRNIRLFYLYTCKQHIYNKGGSILRFYKKHRIKIFVTFLMISLYWRLT